METAETLAPQRQPLITSEDWWAVWAGAFLLLCAATELVRSVPTVGAWTSNVVEGLSGRVPGLILLGAGLAILTGVAVRTMGDSLRVHMIAFGPLYLLAVASYVLAEQRGVKASGFEYVFWALVIGLLISNTVGTPVWLRPAVRGEFYIKTGLVLLGAEILFGRILTLGAPGLFVSWLVTPLVVIFMYLFGTRALGMANKSFVIVIAAATSVCGVSAAIAAAAAARATKEELTLTVGISLMFTVAMMIVMPFGIRVAGMDEAVGAAWIGGTIDSTGAVVAAGAMLGELGEEIAAVVKLIQNTLIGVIAFAIAVFWVTKVEPSAEARRAGGRMTEASHRHQTKEVSLVPEEGIEPRAGVRPEVSEIWHRFPKFILGFVGASLVFSFVLTPMVGEEAVAGIIDRTADLRGWFFCLAFVSIGLDSNMRELGGQLAGGKPVQLYVVGQLFNLVLTLIAAYLAFGGILFEKIQ